jgi:hypothetical protein
MRENEISVSKEPNREDNMHVTRQAMLARQALLKIEPVRGTTQPRADERWVDDLVTVYGEFGGQALDSDIYRRMKQVRQSEGRSWPPSAHSAIRQTRQAHNFESPQYRGGHDLFRMVRPGLWRLR